MQLSADEFRYTMRAAAGERAKGALRAVVAIKGSTPGDGSGVIPLVLREVEPRG